MLSRVTQSGRAIVKHTCGPHKVGKMRLLQGLLLYNVGIGIFIGMLLYCVSVVKSQTITSNLTGNQPVCPGESIIFTCVTRGSPTIEWTSVEYISHNGPGLQFHKFSQLNSPAKSRENANTVASLVSKTVVDGIDVLISQLRIVVLSKFLAASVTCVYGNGSTAIAGFQVLADPDKPQYMVSDQQSDGCGNCTIHISWNVPTNINVTDVTKYMMQINGTNIKNETNENNQKLILTSYPIRACAAHNVSVKAVNRCGRAGRSTNVTVLDPPSRRLPQQDCGDNVYITTRSTSDGVTDAQVKSDCQDSCVSLTVICILLSLLVAIPLVSTIVFAALYCRKLKKQKDETCKVEAEDPQSTPTDSETKDSPL